MPEPHAGPGAGQGEDVGLEKVGVPMRTTLTAPFASRRPGWAMAFKSRTERISISCQSQAAAGAHSCLRTPVPSFMNPMHRPEINSGVACGAS